MKKSELAWQRADYERAGQEVPDRLLYDPAGCEGELMTDEEVTQYIQDGIKTCLILHDKGSPRFIAVQQAFFSDLAFLVKIGRIDRDEYNEIIRDENYSF